MTKRTSSDIPRGNVELDEVHSREAELARQAAVVDAVAEHNREVLEQIAAEQAAEVDVADGQERSASRQFTDAVSTVRQAGAGSRDVEGMAVPYGMVALSTELGAEAFVPGAFRSSIDHWMNRADGARMAFRPEHRQRPVGTVTHLEETPAGVRFRASIFESPAGDEYLSEVAAGLNGVSIEFGPAGSGQSRRGRDGTVIHREARLHAIAGSVSPAYDGARISLRDMEAPMNCPHCGAELVAGVGHSCAGTQAAAAAAAPVQPAAAAVPTAGELAAASNVVTLPTAERSALEAGTVRGIRPATRRVDAADHIYARGSQHSFLFDNWRAAQGDHEAAGRQVQHFVRLAEIAEQMERDAVYRIFAPEVQERAGDVLSSEIPGAYPNDYIPGLLTPRILKGRPMGGFYNRVPISDARPRIFPKVTTSTAVAVQSAEGAALSSTDFATTAVTATPLMYGAYTDVSRQTLDGGDPAAEAMILSDIYEAYSQASEAVIKTAVEAGSTASGVAVTAATPYAGAIANVVNFYATRFRPASGAFIPSAQFSTLLAQADTTGRPLVPQLGVVNSDGRVNVGEAITAPLLSAQGTLSWSSTANVWVFGVPSDFVIYESAIAQFRYDQVVGPQAVRVGIWAYLVVGTRLGSLKVTAA